MVSKYIIPGLALASTVLAQCSSDDTLTIRTQSDVSGLSGCAPYRGNIEVDANYQGALQLDGFTGIEGDLIIAGARQLVTLSSDRITTISGTFRLNGLTALSTLSMSVLQQVNTIDWTALPTLQALNFPQGLSQVNSLTISNTDLRDLRGIELEQVGMININNNRQLNIINVNDLVNITQSLTFNANGRSLNIMLPNLLSAANLTFRDVASVDIPSLSVVRGDMGFYQDSFLNLSAPNLSAVARTLAFVGCNNLVDIDMPKLDTIGGGLLIANNTNLKAVTGLPKLRIVNGAIDVTGTFDAISFPALSTVRGTTNIQTTSTNSSICSIFTNSGSTDVFGGKPVCDTGVADPKSNETGQVGNNGGSGSGNAASTLVANSAAILTAGLGAVVAALIL